MNIKQLIVGLVMLMLGVVSIMLGFAIVQPFSPLTQLFFSAVRIVPGVIISLLAFTLIGDSLE